MLFAIGIRFVGKTVAEKLARHFKTMDTLARATYEQLLEAPEVGEKIAQSVFDFFHRKENLREVERLKKAGLQFESAFKEPEKLSNALDGKSFVISGTFQNYERDQLKDVIVANGGSAGFPLDLVVGGFPGRQTGREVSREGNAQTGRFLVGFALQ